MICLLRGKIQNAKKNFHGNNHGKPEAIAVDAFTQKWRQVGFFWAFPPFSLILKVIQKIRLDKATEIVVVPNWPNQPWFSFFMTLYSQNV